jgi:hypothetical protein
LGRGLRLPFDTYTGLEILDGLEVLGHEKYQELLRKAGVLNEKFVDVRTGAILCQNAQGPYVPQLITTQVSTPVAPAPRRPPTATAPASAVHPPPSPASRWSPASRTTPTRRAVVVVVDDDADEQGTQQAGCAVCATPGHRPRGTVDFRVAGGYARRLGTGGTSWAAADG